MLDEIFNNNLGAIFKIKVALMLKKPAYIEVCILDLNKVLLYELYFDYIKNSYGNNSNLLFTDMIV